MLIKTLASRASFIRSLNNAYNNVKQTKRNHGTWNYRVPPDGPVPKRHVYMAEALGGVLWWWMLYNIVTDPGHIIGEFTYIYPETWTDEELGIPPDSEGQLHKEC